MSKIEEKWYFLLVEKEIFLCILFNCLELFTNV